VPRFLDCEHELAALVRTSTKLFDFKAVEGSGMQPHIGQPTFRQQFPDLVDATDDSVAGLHPQVASRSDERSSKVW
jgi:hypothetical protein